ncbi:MAG: hypothetical protein COA78_23100 [Blastopirellula sp.]|nr:MAG: hypothetical protein COA78_23100 [Blastopirellula sp.]
MQANSSDKQTQILVLGDTCAAEFAPVLSDLVARNIEIVHTATPDQHEFFDSILLFQARPSTIAESTVHNLRRKYPLAKIGVLLGSWCEGEQRTGQPLVCVERIFWHQWPTRADEFLSTTLKLPSTASQNAVIQQDLRQLKIANGNSTNNKIVICANRFEDYDYLAIACKSWGAEPQWYIPGRESSEIPPANQMTLGLWNGVHLDAEATTEFIQFRKCYPNIPMIASLEFPRFNDLNSFHQLCGDAVIGRPFALSDLFSTFDQAIAPNGEVQQPKLYHPAA